MFRLPASPCVRIPAGERRSWNRRFWMGIRFRIWRAKGMIAVFGEQRGIFQDLCAYITEENINRVDQIHPVSDSAWSNYRLLMIKCIGFGLVSRFAVTKVYRSRRRIGIPFRLASPRALCARIRHTKIATALAARRSTVKQVTIAEDRKENNSYNPSQPFFLLSPAFPPLSLDDLCRMGPSTESEGGGHIAIDSSDPPSTAWKRLRSRVFHVYLEP